MINDKPLKPGQYTREEIFSQPEAWLDALEVLKSHTANIQAAYNERSYAQVIFTGCGSTYYLALAAAALFQELSGQAARALPASELWLYPQSSYPKSGQVLLVAISRSGETTETLHACESFLSKKLGQLVTLSCYGEKALAGLGRLNLVLPSGQENSVAQTRAFSTLYLAATALASIWAGQQDRLAELVKLPKAGRRLLADLPGLAHDLGTDRSLERFYFLGSGPRYGLACELSLKMKEMSLSHSEPFHFLEFRHGPQSMTTPETLMVGLLSEVNRQRELAVLDEMRQRGAKILTISETNTEVAFASGISEAMRNVLYLPIGQLLAFERSLDRGLNPDQPHNLTAVVHL